MIISTFSHFEILKFSKFSVKKEKKFVEIKKKY